MRIANYRKLIVALLTLVFIGQTVAATTMPCMQQASQTGSQAHVTDAPGMALAARDFSAQHAAMNHAAKGSSVIDHSQHMNMNSANAMSSADHCTNCDCDVGGCSVTVVPSTEQRLLANLSSLINGHLNLAINQLASSPYHPPE